jgi:predicted DNA-binding ribbon-helix-helix protein
MGAPGGDARPEMRKRSVSIAGHRTSVSLEAPFWEALETLAERRGLSLAGLIAELDAGRAAKNLSSTLRLFVLDRARAGELPRAISGGPVDSPQEAGRAVDRSSQSSS